MRRQLNRDSRNSSMPPSTDPPKSRAERRREAREKAKEWSKRKPGGQAGHEGKIPPDGAAGACRRAPLAPARFLRVRARLRRRRGTARRARRPPGLGAAAGSPTGDRAPPGAPALPTLRAGIPRRAAIRRLPVGLRAAPSSPHRDAGRRAPPLAPPGPRRGGRDVRRADLGGRDRRRDPAHEPRPRRPLGGAGAGGARGRGRYTPTRRAGVWPAPGSGCGWRPQRSMPATGSTPAAPKRRRRSCWERTSAASRSPTATPPTASWMCCSSNCAGVIWRRQFVELSEAEGATGRRGAELVAVAREVLAAHRRYLAEGRELASLRVELEPLRGRIRVLLGAGHTRPQPPRARPLRRACWTNTRRSGPSARCPASPPRTTPRRGRSGTR